MRWTKKFRCIRNNRNASDTPGIEFNLNVIRGTILYGAVVARGD